MAVTRNEITKGVEIEQEYEDNINTLILALNAFAERIDTYYGKHIPLIVNSGVRSKKDQIRIYNEKGITDINKIPMGSAHISCQAVDLRDRDKLIRNFILDCPSVLEELDLYVEDFDATPTWTHIQTRRTSSGKRIFKP